MTINISIAEKINPEVKNFIDFAKSLDFYSLFEKADENLLIKVFSTIDVSVISAQKMQELNFQYREKDKPTDVLSFEVQKDDLLGEMYLCPDEINQNAVYFNNELINEWADVFVHGILHILGYDHSDKMFALQAEIKQKILNDYKNSRGIR